MATRHIVKSFDEALDLLKSKLSEMGREVEDQITKANKALLNLDDGLANVIIVSDEKINVLRKRLRSLVFASLLHGNLWPRI